MMVAYLDDTLLRTDKTISLYTKYVLSFGDDINDKEMLSRCGIGVIMGNALNEIREIADYVCDTNDTDGVARWLAERI